MPNPTQPTNRQFYVKSQFSYFSLVLYSGGFAVILYIIASSAGSSPHSAKILAVLIPMTVLFLVYQTRRHLRITRALALRTSQFPDIAARKNWQYQASSSDVPTEFEHATFPKIDWIEKKFTNYIKGPRWTYVDVSYERKHRSGTTIITLYYSAMTMKASTKLPHILFDSAQARGNQYMFRFKSGQQHKINSTFDEAFTTYAANGSSASIKKFVTPELQEILMKLKDYDVELAGDRIFLYGPLLEAHAQIDDMTQKLQILEKYLGSKALRSSSELDSNFTNVELQKSHLITWATIAIFGVFVTLLILKFTN